MEAALGSGSGGGDMGWYLETFLEPEVAELGQNWMWQVKVIKDDISGCSSASSWNWKRIGRSDLGKRQQALFLIL